MREILFRGKRLDNGEWQHGNLFHNHDGRIFVGELIVTDNIDDSICDKYELGISIAEVDPETVGQFTGLTDKNGKKIFEGDIVRVLGNQQVEDWKNVDYTALIAFLDGGFCAIDGTIENHGFRRYALSRLDFDLEIIGNIHNNPELLED